MASIAAVDGLFSSDPEPHLIGSRCGSCGTYHFPKQTLGCRNPSCEGVELEEVALSRRGRVWSWTTNHYPAPPPSVVSEPYTVVAAELPEERMTILGLLDGAPDVLTLGAEVELVVGTLYTDDEGTHTVWKWRPVS